MNALKTYAIFMIGLMVMAFAISTIISIQIRTPWAMGGLLACFAIFAAGGIWTLIGGAMFYNNHLVAHPLTMSSRDVVKQKLPGFIFNALSLDDAISFIEQASDRGLHIRYVDIAPMVDAWSDIDSESMPVLPNVFAEIYTIETLSPEFFDAMVEQAASIGIHVNGRIRVDTKEGLKV